MWEERERSELAMEQLASQLGATQVGEGPSTRGGGLAMEQLASQLGAMQVGPGYVWGEGVTVPFIPFRLPSPTWRLLFTVRGVTLGQRCVQSPSGFKSSHTPFPLSHSQTDLELASSSLAKSNSPPPSPLTPLPTFPPPPD